jgi:FAD/FMN-containing dehydrogenase
MASLRPSAVVELAEGLRGFHRRGETLASIDLGALARVLEHTPEDMTVTVETGLTLAALQSHLARNGQWLPIDPPNAATLTIADLLNEDRSGPRRFGHGTIREHLLGLQVVLADGRVIRNGGKVVKNVAGYDLCKLFVGARGTLGVIVEATFKLRPLPEAESFVTAPCASPHQVAQRIEAVLDSELTPIVLDLHHLAPHASHLAPHLVLGLAGTREEVQWQLSLAATLGIREPAGLDHELRFWSQPILPRRLSVLPSRLAETIQALGQVPWVARAGNGVIYHHSTLPPAQAGAVFGKGSLHRRIKDAYDPKHIFPDLSL